MRFIIDLDDTLANTTQDLQGLPENLPQLTLVSGAWEFLREYGQRSVLLSTGEKEWQLRKIAHLGIEHLFEQIVILPGDSDQTDARKEKWRAIRKIVACNAAMRMIVIGDRIDREIAFGNMLGCFTIRVQLAHGKYARQVPRTINERPDRSVTNFWDIRREILKAPLYG